MRNGTARQFGTYLRAALLGSAGGTLAGAAYAAVWGLTHWAVRGKGIASPSFGPWLLALGAVLGLVAGLGWAAGGVRQPQGPPDAGARRTKPGIPGSARRISDTALLRRLGG
jgi:hypothetical protein